MDKTDVRSYSDKDLIKTVLGTDDEHKYTIKSVFGALEQKREKLTYTDLISIEGIDHNIALRILSVFEINRRYSSINPLTDKITRPEDILKYITDIRDKKQEYFIVITLNGAGELIQKRIITIGLINHCLVHPREVFVDAITDHAASIICIHNHPSGSLDPSSQDIAITMQLRDAGGIIGISLLDHIIVTKTAHTSLKEKGII